MLGFIIFLFVGGIIVSICQFLFGLAGVEPRFYFESQENITLLLRLLFSIVGVCIFSMIAKHTPIVNIFSKKFHIKVNNGTIDYYCESNKNGKDIRILLTNEINSHIAEDAILTGLIIFGVILVFINFFPIIPISDTVKNVVLIITSIILMIKIIYSNLFLIFIEYENVDKYYSYITKIFDAIKKCSKIWCVEVKYYLSNELNMYDHNELKMNNIGKRNNKPSFIKCNYDSLYIKSSFENSFFPTFYLSKGKVNAVHFYKEAGFNFMESKINITYNVCDATLIREGWLHENNDGSRDQRFAEENNHRINTIKVGTIVFPNNECLYLSNLNVFNEIKALVNEFKNEYLKYANKSVNSIE